MTYNKKSYLKGIFGITLVILILFTLINTRFFETFNKRQSHVSSNSNSKSSDPVLTAYEPYDIYDNGYFRFGYDENHEQARWLSYSMDVEDLNKKRLPRLKEFFEDENIRTGSASPNDYRGSGYSRGHLAPSADFSFSLHSMEETYKMSNISPQAHNFNGGIWRELEEQTRDWARRYHEIHIVTGPILENIKKTIGDNKVSVPPAFFKVLLVHDGNTPKSIGFLIPNDVSYDHLYKYAVSVNEVEKTTGIDFYKSLQLQNEEQIEQSIQIEQWPFNEKRYYVRINEWNKQD